MTKRLVDAATVGLFIAAVALLGSRFWPGADRPPEVRSMEAELIGRPVPEFRVRWLSEVQGPHPGPFESGASSVLIVFRSTCPACRASRPQWRILASRFPGRVVAVTPEEQGPSADYFGTTEIVMGQVVDWATVTASLPIKAVPTTLRIDADGRVVAAYIGTFTEERVEDLLISQD